MDENFTPLTDTEWEALYAAEASEDYDDFPPGCPICDGIHGYYCPIESPDPLYYADEMAAGR